MSKLNRSTKNTVKKDNIKEVKEVKELKEINEIKENSNDRQKEEIVVTEKGTSISPNVHSSYVDTCLICPVMLFPNQMDNKIYLHIKDNLSNKLVGRCYKNYGFIKKIYKIDEISDGIIEPEDPTCSSKFVVKFSCRLCMPIRNKEIILKIDTMSKTVMGAINGPIQAIITPDKINMEKFFIDNNRNIRIRGTSDILLPETYIRVLVLNSKFGDYEKSICVFGFLQDIANEQEKKMFLEENF